METPVTERLTDARFWAIVEEIGWPHVDSDAAKLLLMRAYPPSVMEAVHAAFHRKTADLARAAAVDWCCDSWDDTRAHIVGLGAEVYARNWKTRTSCSNGWSEESTRRALRTACRSMRIMDCSPTADMRNLWCGHLIPNIVRNLERYRLVGDSNERAVI